MSALPSPDGYFDLMYDKWDVVWSRFGEHPELRDQRVLDFGCGFGSFAVRAAEEGASVVGLDASPQAIRGARRITEDRFRRLDVRYVCGRPDDLTDEFDVILSNEVLEHVQALPETLQRLHDLLRPGGTFYAGWGPLWFSPVGGHQLTVSLGPIPVPWSHLVRPLGRGHYRLREGKSFRFEPDYHDFNHLRPAAYRELMESSGFDVQSWKVNPGDHPVYRLLRRAARVAPTAFTTNIYAVLRRANAPR